MTQTPVIRCPYCRSANVELHGAIWHCRDCKKIFEEAAVELPLPPTKPKSTKQRK